ncbi:aconitase X [Thermodesulfobacteriota bacterium]
MMFLTENEKQMLAGANGRTVSKAMEILTALGDIYGAENMVAINSVHLPGASVVIAGDSGVKFVEDMSAGINRLAVFTTLNPSAFDRSQWPEFKLKEDEPALQIRLTEAYEKIGAISCHSCTPYLVGNIPRMGEHIAWGESSAVIYANSVLGARTNREGGPSALASAITGLTPAYGYHLGQNRKGQLLIKVTVPVNGFYDYGNLGYYVGKIAEERIPVFTGIPASVSVDELKSMGAALASSGAVALFHIIGVTPEAPTLETAFGGNEPIEIHNVGEKEFKTVEEKLNKAPGNVTDWVFLGCPHTSIQEYAHIASLLEGKHLNSGVELWVASSKAVIALAESMGFSDIIESAGGRIVCGTCPVNTLSDKIARRNGYQSISTNSAKMAHYMPGQFNILTRYGSTKQCIDAAISGYWE